MGGPGEVVCATPPTRGNSSNREPIAVTIDSTQGAPPVKSECLTRSIHVGSAFPQTWVTCPTCGASVSWYCFDRAAQRIDLYSHLAGSGDDPMFPSPRVETPGQHEEA